MIILQSTVWFLVSGSGFLVSCFVFRDSGSGFLVPGFVFRAPGSGFRVSGSGFRVSGFGFDLRVPGPGFGFRVSGFGFRFPASGFQAHNLEHAVVGRRNAEGRGFLTYHQPTQKDQTADLQITDLPCQRPRKRGLCKVEMAPNNRWFGRFRV
jgi:hypothetical protein